MGLKSRDDESLDRLNSSLELLKTCLDQSSMRIYLLANLDCGKVKPNLADPWWDRLLPILCRTAQHESMSIRKLSIYLFVGLYKAIGNDNYRRITLNPANSPTFRKLQEDPIEHHSK